MPKGIYQHKSPLSDEHKKKLREANKGQIPWIKGKHHTCIVKEKIRQKLRGRKLKQETIEKIKKARAIQIMKIPSRITRIKISKKNKERYVKFPNLRFQIAQKLKGNKSYLWKGGISFEPYSIDWTETLRRSIRERDNYICQLCSQYGNTVHHIDYNKLNCNPANLITLCKNCNTKVNHNRSYWLNYLKGRIKEN